MASIEKQLSEACKKLLSPPSSVTELISSLDQVESLLTQVEQSPSGSLRKELSPLMKALIANELLRHSDDDVKVAVASCISEITRITAPDTPYEDDEMKEVFQLIVSSFEKLDELSSQSYIKRTSILETVAKVRSCVVMLDLECDALIAEMFQHFFKSIRSEHPENIFSSMETIMTLVLEESEDVSVDLVSSILNVLKTENKEVLPVARQLGEKVMEKCVVKIKPCLEQAIKSLHTTLDDYPKVVTNVLKGGSEATKTIDANVTSENLVAVESLDDARPSEGGLSASGSPKSLVANGTTQKEIEDTSAGNDDARETNNEPHCEEAEIEKTKVDSSDTELIKSRTKPEKAKKRKGKKTSLKRSSEPSEPSITDEKKGVEKSELHEKDDKQDGNAQDEVPVADTVEPAENEKEPEVLIPSTKTSDEAVDVHSPSLSGSLSNENASKKVEAEEKNDDLVEDMPASDLDLKESDVKKSSEEASVSEPKAHKRTGKKVPSATDKEDSAPSSAVASKKENEEISELDAKSPEQSSKNVQVGSRLEDRKKRGQGKVTPTKDTAKSLSKDESKKSGSLAKSPTKPAKRESDVEKEPKTSSKRKRSSGKKAPKYGKELVGSKVQVWWPDDKAYYAGIIEHFDPSTGKHKVTYNDGDVEVLKLENEKWKLADGSVSDQGHSSDSESPNEAAEMPKPKKAKMSPGVGAKQGKTEASAKKGGASSSKSKATSKSRSEQKEDKKSVGKAKDETLKSIGKSKDKGGKSKDLKSGNSTQKSGGKSKGNEVEPSKGSNKSKQETPIGVSKSKAKSPKSGSKFNDKNKARAAASSDEEEDEEMESSPEPVKAPQNSKGKSSSKSQKSTKKRKRGTKG